MYWLTNNLYIFEYHLGKVCIIYESLLKEYIENLHPFPTSSSPLTHKHLWDTSAFEDYTASGYKKRSKKRYKEFLRLVNLPILKSIPRKPSTPGLDVFV